MEPIEVGFQAYPPIAGRSSAQGDRFATNQWTDVIDAPVTPKPMKATRSAIEPAARRQLTANGGTVGIDCRRAPPNGGVG